ncbi:hypothetical protein F511_42012 [Dorcoceras hygrometricum]|uniref:Uncharacterized protein n=1 Tax=Dorcoceras hygrometricum TaxID=472368 RepID=A0A2Z7CR04_9LAMI|nr:hypothetical protein F511_42012 [Dorcoceras hygrometricum]
MVKRRRFDKLKRSVLGATLLDQILAAKLLFTERFFPRFLSILAFVIDDFGGAGFLVSCSVDCYSLEVVERLVEVSVKLLVYEDFWRNMIEHSLIVVRFWNGTLLASRCLAPTNFTRKLALQRLAVVVLRIRSTTGITTPSSVCTRKRDEFITDGISSSRWSEQVQPQQQGTAAGGGASTIGGGIPSSACTRRPDEICADGFSSSNWPERIPATRGGGTRRRRLCERGGAAT